MVKKVYIPSKVASSVKGYELLLRMHNDLMAYENHVIELSFQNVTWFEANLTAIVGAIIEELENKGNTVSLRDCNGFHEQNDILTRNGFFPYYGIRLRQNRFSSTHITYRKFQEKDLQAYNAYIQKELIENPEFPKDSIF